MVGKRVVGKRGTSHNDDDNNDDDDDDLYIIGAVCLSDTKMLTFRIQRILLFLLFTKQ